MPDIVTSTRILPNYAESCSFIPDLAGLYPDLARYYLGYSRILLIHARYCRYCRLLSGSRMYTPRYTMIHTVWPVFPLYSPIHHSILLNCTGYWWSITVANIAASVCGAGLTLSEMCGVQVSPVQWEVRCSGSYSVDRNEVTRRVNLFGELRSYSGAVHGRGSSK